MKKLIFICFVFYLWCFAIFNSVNRAFADDYNQAVVAHVIKEKISGNGVDMSVLEAEMHKLAYSFALEATDIIEKHLPNILESIATELRMNADSKYKCALLVTVSDFIKIDPPTTPVPLDLSLTKSIPL